MDYSKLDILLSKYWECETSLEEENQLREFFASHKDDARWAKEAALFRYFEKSRSDDRLGELFDHRIMEKISGEASRRGAGKGRRMWVNFARVAAAVIILTTAGYFLRQDILNDGQEVAKAVNIDTYEDPKQAFEETKRALMMLSQSMGKGTSQAQKVSIFHEAQETVRNEIEPEFEEDNNTQK